MDANGYTYIPTANSTPSQDKNGYMKFPEAHPKQSESKKNYTPVTSTEIDGYLQPVDAQGTHNTDNKVEPSQQSVRNFLSRFGRRKGKKKLNDIIAMDERYTDMKFVRTSPVLV